MKKKIIFISAVLIFSGGAYWLNTSKESSHSEHPTGESEADEYYTCPMHPHINQDHPGECPICHMKLVKATRTKKNMNEHNHAEGGGDRSVVSASNYQLKLVGLQKVSPEKMTLHLKIPIAGRFVSSDRVAFQVYESDLRFIQEGLAFSGSTILGKIKGRIQSIDSYIDPTSRTIRVVGLAQEAPKNIYSEMTFSGNIEIELKNRLAIPESSVLFTGSGALVYVVDSENNLTPQNITLGAKTQGYYEVIEGLTEKDAISSGPNFLVDSEAKIRGAND